MNTKLPIGVFDSGVGGISVLNEIKKIMPHEEYLYYGDSKYAPYGIKSKQEIRERCNFICDFFIQQQVKAIVIACNTATSACVNELRKKYAQIPIVGMEPALKVATQSEKAQNILVLATDFTLKEEKFSQLMARFETQHTIYKQPCPKLVEIVENGQLKNSELVQETLHTYLQPYDLSKIDSIVLGCTHFVFYRDILKELLPKHIELIDGNQGTAKHLQALLKERGQLITMGEGDVTIYNSMEEDDHDLSLSQELLTEG